MNQTGKPESHADYELEYQDIYDGISGDLRSKQGDALKAVMVIFIALSCYNILELFILVLSTFRRWKGLYFWSLLVSGVFGVVPYSIGFLLKFFSGANSLLSVSILTIGWWAMVTGQALVLYSRLHLVLRDERILSRVLYMIIANVFLLHVPTTVLTYGSNVLGASNEDAEERSPWVKGYNIMEKIQMTGFTIQEVIISALYVWETIRMLQLGSSRENRKIMHQLVSINVLIVLMDLMLLGLEYASIYSIQITLKGVVYSVKLKLEFAVLGKLVDVVHSTKRTGLTSPIILCSQQGCDSSGRFSTSAHGGVADGQGRVMNLDSNTPSSQTNVALPDGRVLAMMEATWVGERPSKRRFHP
ncbi:uncharacterized protein BDV17DRAFT_130865 [Aspergillus undulatus]|uniref:uncharacterized protein n=1 Tax=Aspergillus undulatus TaxID=1810928 RepID=UPI003CCDE9FC